MKQKAIVLLLAGALAAQSAFLGGCSGGTDRIGQPEMLEAAQETAEEEAVLTGPQEGGEESGAEEAAAAGGDTAAWAEEVQKPDAGYEDGANGFAFRFSREMLAKKEQGENMIISPYSVWLPLAALVNGTEETAKEALLSALGCFGMEDAALNEAVKNEISILTQEEQTAWMKEHGMDGYESPLKIANALFVDRSCQVNQAFEAVFADSYAGQLFSVDFADASAVQEVNGWAYERTEGRIDQIVDSFDPAAVAAIANAVYYADGWAKKFPSENTQNDIFHGFIQEQEVPFLYGEFNEMPYYEDDTLQAVTLGTATGGGLTILLPKEGVSAEELLAGMDAEAFETLMEAEEATVHLWLPRFQVESEIFSVKEALERLGVPLTDSVGCHLDGIVEGERLYISQAVQKAMIEVDEEGMTAAAVTVMVMERMSMPFEREPVEMKCDRPFAFLLSAPGSGGQQVLFTGVVNQIEP